MRNVTAMLFALSVSAAAALAPFAANAAEDEGKIADIDPNALTITLENGNTYKLSVEFDVAALSEGMDVVLAYDTIEGENQVTDLVTYD